MQRMQPTDFAEVVQLIENARQRAYHAVNRELISLYWSVGEYVSRKVSAEAWGKGTVESLATHVQRNQLNLKGFSAQNIWRMRQFYEAYQDAPILSPLVRELPWTHNMIILGQSKRIEEREFYLKMAIQEKWSKRELERQLAGALFERMILKPAKLSPALRQTHPDAINVFKDSYLVDFLTLPADHSEADLHQGLLAKLKHFLLLLTVFFADSRVASVLTQSRTMCTLLRCAPLRLALDKKSSSGGCVDA